MKFLICFLSTIFFGGILLSYDGAIKKTEMDITFCQFSLNGDLKKAHTSFTVGYSFRIDENGKPKELNKIIGDQLSDEQVSNCISKWRFSNIDPKSMVTVFFRWEHAKGWTELKVSGKDFSQKVRINGEKCPYSKMEKDSK